MTVSLLSSDARVRGVSAPTRGPGRPGVPWAPADTCHLQRGRVRSAWQRARAARAGGPGTGWARRTRSRLRGAREWPRRGACTESDGIPGGRCRGSPRWRYRCSASCHRSQKHTTKSFTSRPPRVRKGFRVLGRERAPRGPMSVLPEAATPAGHRHPPPPAEGWQSAPRPPLWAHDSGARSASHAARNFYVRCVSKGSTRGRWVRNTWSRHSLCCWLLQVKTWPLGRGLATWASCPGPVLGSAGQDAANGQHRRRFGGAARCPRTPHGGRGPGTGKADDLPGKTSRCLYIRSWGVRR